jgi:hypothetical protein
MSSRRRKADAGDAVRRRTLQLLDRLNDHALGTAELSATQLRAIELLLKTLPALAAAADGEGGLQATVKGALVWNPPVA